MASIIDRAATGLGDGIGLLADRGVLFILFALIWAGFAVGLIWSQGSIDAVWETVRGWPLVVEGVVWVLFLPVMLAVWIWETSLHVVLRLMIVASLAGWTLLILPRPWS